MPPDTTKTPPLNTARYFLWFGTSFAAIIAIVLAVGQYFSITQLLIRLSLIVAVHLLAAPLLKRFPPRARPITPSDPLEAITFRTFLPLGIGTLWIFSNFIILSYGNGGMRFVSALIWQFPITIGSTLIGASFIRRVGDSLHCPHCEYPYTFEDADAPIRCPECGKGWLGVLKKGRKKWHFKRTLIGIALVFFGVVVLNPIFYIGWLAPQLPTPLLYVSTFLTPPFIRAPWDELATRNLSPYWTTRIANRVISLREHDPISAGSRWFEKVAAAGAISSEMRETYYEGGFQADLLLPKKAGLNQSFTAALRIFHTARGSSEHPGILFAGYYIDDSKVAVGRIDETKWMHDLSPGSFSPHRDCLEQPITIATKGNHTIRVVYWLVYLPSFNDPLKWLPSGTPAPIPAATWIKRYEFSKTIHVD